MTLRLLPLAVALAAFVLSCGGGGSGSVKTADQVIADLRAAGLPITDVTSYKADNDPNELLGRPGQYVSKATFRDSRLPAPSGDLDIEDGGSVETFSSEADAKRRQEYVATVTKSVPMFAEYGYRNGRVLVRVSGKLTPDQAKAYESSVKGLK